MPSRELSTSVMSGSCPTVGPDWVAARVREPAAPESALLLLDCRPPDQFARCRLRGALGVSLPASLLVLRRLSNGKLCVSSVLRDARQRDAFEACYRQLPIVLYDADGSYADVQVTGVLVQRLRQDGCQVFCLQGEKSAPNVIPLPARQCVLVCVRELKAHCYRCSLDRDPRTVLPSPAIRAFGSSHFTRMISLILPWFPLHQQAQPCYVERRKSKKRNNETDDLGGTPTMVGRVEWLVSPTHILFDTVSHTVTRSFECAFRRRRRL